MMNKKNICKKDFILKKIHKYLIKKKVKLQNFLTDTEVFI